MNLSEQELDAAIKASVMEHAHPIDEEGTRVSVGGVSLDDKELVESMRQAFTDAGWSKADAATS